MRPKHLSLFAVLAFAIAATLGACAKTAIIDPDDLPKKSDPTIAMMLTKVQTVPVRPNPAGYERGCGKGEGCVFGQAWKDVNRNGCDTRNDILKRDLDHEVFRDNNRHIQCVVISGNGRDPYTGGLIEFRKADANEVQIDHVFPLAYAWDMGADRWPLEERERFANDPSNLAATLREVNQSKSDKSPAEWMDHVTPTKRCDYGRAFLTVALAYNLPITTADAKAIRAAAKACV